MAEVLRRERAERAKQKADHMAESRAMELRRRSVVYNLKNDMRRLSSLMVLVQCESSQSSEASVAAGSSPSAERSANKLPKLATASSLNVDGTQPRSTPRRRASELSKSTPPSQTIVGENGLSKVQRLLARSEKTGADLETVMHLENLEEVFFAPGGDSTPKGRKGAKKGSTKPAVTAREVEPSSKGMQPSVLVSPSAASPFANGRASLFKD